MKKQDAHLSSTSLPQLIYVQTIYGVRATVSLRSSPPQLSIFFFLPQLVFSLLCLLFSLNVGYSFPTKNQIYWNLGIRTAALHWAHKFLDNAQCSEWRFNITFGMGFFLLVCFFWVVIHISKSWASLLYSTQPCYR